MNSPSNSMKMAVSAQWAEVKETRILARKLDSRTYRRNMAMMSAENLTRREFDSLGPVTQSSVVDLGRVALRRCETRAQLDRLARGEQVEIDFAGQRVLARALPAAKARLAA